MFLPSPMWLFPGPLCLAPQCCVPIVILYQPVVKGKAWGPALFGRRCPGSGEIHSHFRETQDVVCSYPPWFTSEKPIDIVPYPSPDGCYIITVPTP